MDDPLGHIIYEGGDGSSEADAIVIRNARDPFEAVAAMYAYIRRTAPQGWRCQTQPLAGAPGCQVLDIIQIGWPGGGRWYYFDVTELHQTPWWEQPGWGAEPPPGLSPYERCVYEEHLAGKSYREIAAAVGRTERSVGSALQRIRRKSSRAAGGEELR